MSLASLHSSREQIEVHRFNLATAIGVPLLALFLQAFVPLKLHFFSVFDLPLLVTVFFAVARRSPVSGLLTGGLIGLAQDSITHQPIGLYGIAKTVIGYAASSLGMKLDVENPGSRLLMIWVFYIFHQVLYFAIARGLLGQTLELRWGHILVTGLANGLLSVVLFALLDQLKQRR